MPFQRMSNTWQDYFKKPLEFSTYRRRFFPLSYNLTNLNRPVLLDNDDMIVSMIKYDILPKIIRVILSKRYRIYVCMLNFTCRFRLGADIFCVIKTHLIQ